MCKHFDWYVVMWTDPVATWVVEGQGVTQTCYMLATCYQCGQTKVVW